MFLAFLEYGLFSIACKGDAELPFGPGFMLLACLLVELCHFEVKLGLLACLAEQWEDLQLYGIMIIKHSWQLLLSRHNRVAVFTALLDVLC